MKYLKYFEQASAYEAYKNGSDYVTPNVSYVENSDIVMYNPYVEPPFEIEIPSPYTQWARIQHNNGTLYTAEEWVQEKTAGNVTNSDVNGIAVLYSESAICPHIIYPQKPANISQKTIWSSNTSTNISELSDKEFPDDAKLDTDGKNNTDIILEAIKNGIISDAPAAQYCASITFNNGQKGYLPSAGEVQAWKDNSNAIFKCMNAIEYYYITSDTVWTSTESDDVSAWVFYGVYASQSLGSRTKNIDNIYNTGDDIYAHPATSFEYNPKNEFSNK